MATREEYVAKAQDALEKIQAQIDELRVQADLAQAEARDKLEPAIDELRNRGAQIKARLDEASKSGADTWKSAASQVEDAVDGLGDTFSKLVDDVQAAAGSASSATKAGFSAFLDEWSKQRDERKSMLSEA